MGWQIFFFFSSHSTSKRDVISLIQKKLPITVTASCHDTEGRYVLVKGALHSENILLGNVCAPNVPDEAFYAFLLHQLVDMDSINMIIGGDFNCTLRPTMDRLPSQTIQSKKAVLNIYKEFDLLDIWRHYNLLIPAYIQFSNLLFFLMATHSGQRAC